MKTDVFQNLLELTHIFEDMFRCDTAFSLLDDVIELSIESMINDNTYHMKVTYDFKIDDVIKEFKGIVISEALNIWRSIN